MKSREFCRSTLRLVGRVEVGLAIAILSVIVATILSQVFSRYVLGRPLIWAEELATYLLIWLAFVAASATYKMRRHIAIQTYGAFAGHRVRCAGNALIHAIVAAVLIVVILYIPDAMRTESLRRTVGLPVTIRLHWFFSVPTLIAFVSMTATAVFYAIDGAMGGEDPILATIQDPSLTDAIFDGNATPGGTA